MAPDSIIFPMGNGLKRLRTERGWTHEEAADAMGLSRGQFIKLERGERGLTERTIAMAARAFGVTNADVLSDGAPIAGIRPPPEILGERDMKVFAAVEGGSGEMVVSTDPIEIVQRPWYMREVRDGYGVLIVGESMVPVFDPGDIAVVNPRLPPVRGKDVILVGDEAAGEFRASIKRLMGQTPTHWKLLQFNPPKGQKPELNWPKKEWPRALRVVGKYYGS